MFSTRSLLITLLVGLGTVSALAVGNLKRQTDSSEFSLYAYNSDIDGLPIFYGDGIAYIGKAIPTHVSQSVNITFAPDTTDPTTWSISPNTTSWKSEPVLYINPASGQFDSVGFFNSTTNSSLPSGAVTSGFTFYGQVIMYQGSSGAMEAKFWAKPTNQTGLWILKWNSDGTTQGGSLPVVVKSTPPTSITRLMD